MYNVHTRLSVYKCAHSFSVYTVDIVLCTRCVCVCVCVFVYILILCIAYWMAEWDRFKYGSSMIFLPWLYPHPPTPPFTHAHAHTRAHTHTHTHTHAHTHMHKTHATWCWQRKHIGDNCKGNTSPLTHQLTKPTTGGGGGWGWTNQGQATVSSSVRRANGPYLPSSGHLAFSTLAGSSLLLFTTAASSTFSSAGWDRRKVFEDKLVLCSMFYAQCGLFISFLPQSCYFCFVQPCLTSFPWEVCMPASILVQSWCHLGAISVPSWCHLGRIWVASRFLDGRQVNKAH